LGIVITKAWPNSWSTLATSTYGEDRTEVDLVELVMKEKKGQLDATQMEVVRTLLADASSLAVQVDTET